MPRGVCRLLHRVKLLPHVVLLAITLVPGVAAGLFLSRHGLAMFSALLGVAPLLLLVFESLFLPGRPPPASAPRVRESPYRVPAPPPPSPRAITETPPVVRRALAREHLSRTRSLAVVTLLACLPGLALCVSFVVQRWPDASTWALPFLPAVPILAFATLLRLYLFLCPRCRDLFFVTKWLHPGAVPDVFRVWHCPHCDVRTGIPGPPR